MIQALVSDFSRVILLPKDENYTEGLNALHGKLSASGDYNFWSYFQLNNELLAFYKTTSQSLDVYLFTSEYIQEHPALRLELKGVFKTIFSGARLGLKKNDAGAYKVIAQTIGLKPEEILYVDDNSANLNAAKEAGMVTICYKSNVQVKKDLTSALNLAK